MLVSSRASVLFWHESLVIEVIEDNGDLMVIKIPPRKTSVLAMSTILGVYRTILILPVCYIVVVCCSCGEELFRLFHHQQSNRLPIHISTKELLGDCKPLNPITISIIVSNTV